MEEDDDLTYVIPKEGTMIWVDGLCIPKGAPNMDNAYKFMNYVHEPEVVLQEPERAPTTTGQIETA
ncbi:MAG: extracellular solute-binding protein [Woeseiaceae bacterium]